MNAGISPLLTNVEAPPTVATEPVLGATSDVGWERILLRQGGPPYETISCRRIGSATDAGNEGASAPLAIDLYAGTPAK